MREKKEGKPFDGKSSLLGIHDTFSIKAPNILTSLYTWIIK